MALPKLQNSAQLQTGFSLPINNNGTSNGAQKSESVDQQNNNASVFNQAKADEQQKDKKSAKGVGGEMGKIAAGNEGPTAAGEVGNTQGTGAIEGGNGSVAVNAQNGTGTQIASNNDGGQQEGYKQGVADTMKKFGLSEGLC